MIYMYPLLTQKISTTVSFLFSSSLCFQTNKQTLQAMASPSSPTPLIHQISKCFIRPVTASIPEEVLSKAPIYLNKSDLSQLSGSYHTSGLLFSKPPPLPSNDHIHEQQTPPVVVMNTIIQTLKDSLSKVLVHFYPLAGRLKTHKQDSDYYIYIDCSNPPLGAEFVHASTDLTLDDILSPVDVPTIVESFFLYNGAVNHDGHTLPLLGVQVTELIDGYFIGCSFNHAVGDGTSFWNFINSWSEISSSNGTVVISNPPVLKQWFLEGGRDSIINLPYSAPEDFIDRYTPKPFRVRVFHFSAESMSRLECKANQDSSSSSSSSSFQSLCALLWRCVTRARAIPSDEISRCFINIGDGAVMGTAEVGELLSHDVGWSALLLNQAIDTYKSELVRKKAEGRIESSPTIRNVARIMDGRFLLIGSLKYDVYGIDFGWGKPLSAHRGVFGFDGKITAFPGREGGTSIDLVCRLSSETLTGLESDEEFMNFVSPPTNIP